MRDDELRRILTDANPWWRTATSGDRTAWKATHRVLQGRGQFDLGYRSQVLVDITAGPLTDALVVLAGSRRVGKSVILMDSVDALCRRSDIDPRQIIHIPCDQLAARDLRRVLTLGRELTRSVDREQIQRRIWLFDEITQITGWTATLKTARDGTPFGDDTVVATGSRWVKGADAAANLFAGRAGLEDTRRLRHVAPMSFRDYLIASGRHLHLLEPVHPAHLQEPGVRRSLEAVAFDVDGYDVAWQEYLTCGGFPRAVAEQVRDGQVSTAYLKDLQAWLLTDVDADAPPESIPRLLSELEQRGSSPLNVTAAAEALGYPNRPTLDRRVDRLVATFAALRCPQRSDDGNIIIGSRPKVYLADPLLGWLPHFLRRDLPSPDMTRLTEMTVGVTLARVLDDLDEGRWLAGDTVGYARTDSGNEVDLCPVDATTPSGSERTVPIESKWVDAGWRGEGRVIAGKYNAGVLATKSVLDVTEAVWAVPAPLVCLLLR
ncbi:MAG: ATP-binding protein [Actinobacteria bacterium]|nr:ATP-binding protein [Actinomycetota bacterium]